MFSKMCEYIKSSLVQFKAIKIKDFGVFSFEVISNLNPKCDFKNSNDNLTNLSKIIVLKKKTDILRAKFYLDMKFKKLIMNYNESTNDLVNIKGKKSKYSKDFELINCNPLSIAKLWYYFFILLRVN
jgi:hypothetical protein